MSNFTNSNMLMNIILIIIIIAVVIFAIISSIMGRKSQKIEREKRKKQVKDKIKQFIKDKYNRKNLRLEYEKVIALKGKEFKYRDIFDVIVDIYEAKKNSFLEQRAFEIEGISKKINKKQYETIWIVNKEIDLEETKYRIQIIEKKIKLTKAEKKAIKIAKKKEYELHYNSIIKNNKNKWKFRKIDKFYDNKHLKSKTEKFIPRK